MRSAQPGKFDGVFGECDRHVPARNAVLPPLAGLFGAYAQPVKESDRKSPGAFSAAGKPGIKRRPLAR